MVNRKKSALALAAALSGFLSAPAMAEQAAPPAPIVLNGQLRTADFTGGVGTAPGGAYDYAPSTPYWYAPRSEFARTLAFIAAARNRALHHGVLTGHAFGHR